MDLLDNIVTKINYKYKGNLNCEQQRADLFIYVDGNEETIDSITTKSIELKNGESIKLIDADIHSLAYINQVI